MPPNFFFLTHFVLLLAQRLPIKVTFILPLNYRRIYDTLFIAALYKRNRFIVAPTLLNNEAAVNINNTPMFSLAGDYSQAGFY